MNMGPLLPRSSVDSRPGCAGGISDVRLWIGTMPVSDAEITSLAGTHDIIAIGMRADEVRRSLHGAATTFVRVADVAATGPIVAPPAAGEIRIGGVPASRPAAVERVAEVVSQACGVPVSGFSLADL